MKKFILSLALVVAGVAAQAQGTVNWTGVAGSFIGTTNSSQYSSFFGGGATSVNGTSGNTASTALGGGVYYYELLTSSGLSSVPTTLSQFGSNLATSWVDTGLSMTNGNAANGRAVQINAVQNATANNWASGATQNIIMVGWSSNLGTTWTAALASLLAGGGWSGNAYFGVGQSVGSLTIASANPGISIFGSNAGQINDTGANALVMNLVPVPEPTTIALAGLGGVALLALRRKK